MSERSPAIAVSAKAVAAMLAIPFIIRPLRRSRRAINSHPHRSVPEVPLEGALNNEGVLRERLEPRPGATLQRACGFPLLPSQARRASAHRKARVPSRTSLPCYTSSRTVSEARVSAVSRACGVPLASAFAMLVACFNSIFGGIGGSKGSTTASIRHGPGVDSASRS